MARRRQGRRDSDRAGMLTSRLTNAPAPVVKPPAPKPYADPAPVTPAPRAPVAPKTAPVPTPAPVVAPKPVVKPPAPKPYADPAPVTPAPRAPVTPKTFTAPAPAPVAEVITDINADSTIDDTTAWELPEYAYGIKVADDKALADALTRQHSNPAQRTPLLEHYEKVYKANTYEWNDATGYSSAEEGLANYGSELANMEEQFRDHTTLNNAKLMRNEGRQQTLMGFNPEGLNATSERMVSYLETNNIPLSKEINGQTVYLTLGTDLMKASADQIYYADSGITDDQGGRNDNLGKFVSHGEVGTYSTIYQPPVSDMDNPYVAVAAALIPGAGAMLATIKGLSGETLHASDWGKIVTTGLELSGDLVVPTAEAPEGAGFNFGNTTLTYDQSTNLLDAAATGDPISAVMGVYGNGLIEDAVGSSEALQGSLDALGMSPDAFASAASKAATKLAQGEDLDDSLISGLGTYIKEGGGVGAPDLGLGDGGMFEGVREAGREFDDAVLQPIKELVESVAGSVIDGLGEVGSAVVDLGSQVNKDVVKPAVDVVQDVAETVVEAGSEAHKTVTQPIFRAIDEAGSQFDDAALQPIKDVVESVASQVGQAGSEFDDAVLQPTKDFLEGLGSGLEDAIKAGGSVFDDVVLQPLKDLLEGLFDIVSPVAETVLGGLAGGAVAPQAPLSATRTTDELFSSMIELGSTQERLEFEDFDSDPFGDTTQGYSI